MLIYPCQPLCQLYHSFYGVFIQPHLFYTCVLCKSKLQYRQFLTESLAYLSMCASLLRIQTDCRCRGINYRHVEATCNTRRQRWVRKRVGAYIDVMGGDKGKRRDPRRIKQKQLLCRTKIELMTMKNKGGKLWRSTFGRFGP